MDLDVELMHTIYAKDLAHVQYLWAMKWPSVYIKCRLHCRIHFVCVSLFSQNISNETMRDIFDKLPSLVYITFCKLTLKLCLGTIRKEKGGGGASGQGVVHPAH